MAVLTSSRTGDILTGTLANDTLAGGATMILVGVTLSSLSGDWSGTA